MDLEVRAKKTEFKNSCFAEIKYEELEKDPLEEIRKLYLSLGLEMSLKHENNIRKFCSGHIHFQKNTYTLTNEQREAIIDQMKDYMSNHQYSA